MSEHLTNEEMLEQRVDEYSGRIAVLERERDEARKEKERAETKCAAEYEAHKMTQAERDKLRAEMEKLKVDKARLMHGLSVTLQYPRGSESQIRCLEELAQDFRAEIDAAMKGEP